MTLRVYLEDNDGKPHSIDYGLNGEDYQSIIKVEILEDSTKLKTWIGSKFVNISESPQSPKQQTTSKQYEIFDIGLHDTDFKFYWITAMCSNCNQTSQLAIPKGEAVQTKKVSNTPCNRCKISKTLFRVKWNGKEYVRTRK